MSMNGEKGEHKTEEGFFAPMLPFIIFLLSGCLETTFDFKTQVESDGSVLRRTKIAGRGAAFFKAPEKEGWKSNTWETKGEGALLAQTEYHIASEGRFRAGHETSSDYELDLSKRFPEWGEKEKKRLAEAGIRPPFEENLYSRNQIRLNRVQGWLTVTTVYEETFQNKGVLELLLLDLKDEIRRQGEIRQEKFEEAELEVMAQLRMEDEILAGLRFKSELQMPGKLLKSNARRVERGKAVWEFSMKDFADGYSRHTLWAISRSFRLPGIMVVAGGLLLALTFFVLGGVGVKQRRPDRKPKRL